MTKLSDTQAILLSAAAQRADGNLLPLPGSLRGGAAVKVVGALLARGLAREEVTDRTDPRRRRAQHRLAQRGRRPRRPPEDHARGARGDRRRAGAEGEPEAAHGRRGGRLPVQRGHQLGRRAGGGPPAPRREAPKKRGRPKKTRPQPRSRARRRAAPRRPRKTRDDTKQAQLIAMLRRKEGATIAQIVAATGWQPHTVRGAFAGALKKKLGLTVTSEKVEGGERVYRIA